MRAWIIKPPHSDGIYLRMKNPAKLIATICCGLMFFQARPAAWAGDDRPGLYKERHGCIAVLLEEIDPVRQMMLDALSEPLDIAGRKCAEGMTYAVRVSPFDLSSERYPIDRMQRADFALGSPYNGFNDEFVVTIQADSPIDSVRYTLSDGMAQVFETRSSSRDGVDCLVSSLSADRSSAILEISLYRIAYLETWERKRVEAMIDAADVRKNAAAIKQCMSEFFSFVMPN